MAFAFADVVREEIADLFAAGADIVQLDEPWMESRAEQARALRASRRCSARSTACTGTTALHICFGYPLFVPEPPPRATRSWPSSPPRPVDQISIETAQANLDLVRARRARRQDDHPRRASRSTRADVETPETVAERIRRALPYKGADELVAAPDCGMKYLPRERRSPSSQALVAGAELVRSGLSGLTSTRRPKGGMLRKRAGRGSAGSSGFGRDSVWVPVGRLAPRPGPVSLATSHRPRAPL